MGLEQDVQRRMEKERAAEAVQNSLKKMLWDTKICNGHGQSEVKVEKMRNARIKHEEASELARSANHLANLQAARAKEATLRLEEKFANELAKQNAQKIRVEAHQRRMVNDSEELRALKGKIAEARMNQSRHLQKAEAERRAVAERKDEIEVFQKIEAEEQAAKLREDQARLDRCIAVQKEQQGQIQEKESRKIEARRIALEERAAVEEIVARIAVRF